MATVTFDHLPIFPWVTASHKARIPLIKHKPRQNQNALSSPAFPGLLRVYIPSRKTHFFLCRLSPSHSRLLGGRTQRQTPPAAICGTPAPPCGTPRPATTGGLPARPPAASGSAARPRRGLRETPATPPHPPRAARRGARPGPAPSAPPGSDGPRRHDPAGRFLPLLAAARRPPPPVGGAGSGPDPAAAGIAGGRVGGAAAAAGSHDMSHPSPLARPSKPCNPRAFFDVDVGGERGGEGAGRGPGGGERGRDPRGGGGGAGSGAPLCGTRQARAGRRGAGGSGTAQTRARPRGRMFSTGRDCRAPVAPGRALSPPGRRRNAAPPRTGLLWGGGEGGLPAGPCALPPRFSRQKEQPRGKQRERQRGCIGTAFPVASQPRETTRGCCRGAGTSVPLRRSGPPATCCLHSRARPSTAEPYSPRRARGGAAAGSGRRASACCRCAHHLSRHHSDGRHHSDPRLGLPLLASGRAHRPP